MLVIFSSTRERKGAFCICVPCVCIGSPLFAYLIIMHKESVQFILSISLCVCHFPVSLYPSFDSLFSCQANCWFSSLTHRHISSPAVLSALSGMIHAWGVVIVCMCVSVCVLMCR